MFDDPKCPACDEPVSIFKCADAAVSGEMYRIQDPLVTCEACDQKLIVRSYTVYELVMG